MDGSWWRVLTKCKLLEEEMATHSSMLAVRTPWTAWKSKTMTPEDKPPRWESVQNATGEEWKSITNSSRNNEEPGTKQKPCSVVDESGGESKVQRCKEQYCLGNWNVRPVNQGKLDVVKQEMAKQNTDISGISKLKWTGMGEFNSDDHSISYSGPRIH